MFNTLWNFSYIVLRENIYESLQASACENKVAWRNDVENSSIELKKEQVKTYHDKIFWSVITSLGLHDARYSSSSWKFEIFL
jgi:hypothetical protein